MGSENLNAIYDYVVDLSCEKKIINLLDLEYILRLLNKNKKYKLVKRIICTDTKLDKEEGSFVFGSYKYNGILTIYMNDLYEAFFNKENKHGITDIKRSYLTFNLKILQAFLHEYEHAYQSSLFEHDESPDDLFSYLELEVLKPVYEFAWRPTKISKDDFTKYIKNKYLIPNNCKSLDEFLEIVKELYRYNPSERLAEIKSHYKIKLMTQDNKFNMLDEKSIDYYNALYIQSEINRYKYNKITNVLEAPTYKYLDGINQEKEKEKLLRLEENYEGLNELKLIYGLNINNDIYSKKLLKLYNLSNKYKK